MSRTAKRDSTKDLLLVIGAFAGVIIIAVVLTLFFRSIAATQSTGQGNFVTNLLGLVPPPEVVPNELPMQEAYAACRARVVSETGSNLMSTRFDNRSSRYNASNREYIIFLNVYMRPADRGGDTMELWSRCNVSAVTAEITEFRLNSDAGFFGVFNM